MYFMDYFPKLILASLIGFIAGWERSCRRPNSQIGVGTTSILVVGATLITIISKYNLGLDGDPGRLIANIITSLGFICSGVIFMKPNQDENDTELIGLTTSVTLFALAGIGIAIGLGEIGLALTTFTIVEFNILMSRFRKKRRDKTDDLKG